LNVSKQIDKMAGAEREIVAPGPEARDIGSPRGNQGDGLNRLRLGELLSGRTPVTRSRRQKKPQSWDGWGTALAPAWEPIVLAQEAFQ
jgi:hypothetical protein